MEVLQKCAHFQYKKTCSFHMRQTKAQNSCTTAQVDQRDCFSVHIRYNISGFLIQIYQRLTSFVAENDGWTWSKTKKQFLSADRGRTY